MTSFCTPLQIALKELNDSIRIEGVINENYEFSNRTLQEFFANNSLDKRILRSIEKSNKHANNSCLNNFEFYSLRYADSVRKEIRNSYVDKNFEDSINNFITELYLKRAGKERDSLHNQLKGSTQYLDLIKSQNERERRFLYISEIRMTEEYSFFTISILFSYSHYFTTAYLFQLKNGRWKLAVKRSW